jgi:hypothetical protein
MATRGCACSPSITVIAPILAVKMATTNSSHVFDPHQVDGSVEFEQSNFLWHKDHDRQQEILIFLVNSRGSASHNCLERGSRAGSSVQTVTLKFSISARLAVSVPSLSTHADEPKMVLAVAKLQAMAGTPTTSAWTR